MVAGTGEVAVPSGGGEDGSVVVPELPATVVPPELEGADDAGRAVLPPSREETTTAVIAPAPATTATPAASMPFLTGSQATLARPWTNGSKSS